MSKHLGELPVCLSNYQMFICAGTIKDTGTRRVSLGTMSFFNSKNFIGQIYFGEKVKRKYVQNHILHCTLLLNSKRFTQGSNQN